MKTVRTWCIRILMILFTVIFLYPLFWNLMSAFKTNAEYLTDPYALPAALNLDNFVAAWQKANIAAYFGNSIFVTVLSTVLLLLLVIPISYVLARYRFVGSRLISTVYMACIFLQATYIMIPLFLELQAVNGLNNLPVLCLVYAVMQFPFCIFTLQGFMSAVPRDYEESARIDGATNIQLFVFQIGGQIGAAILNIGDSFIHSASTDRALLIKPRQKAFYYRLFFFKTSLFDSIEGRIL